MIWFAVLKPYLEEQNRTGTLVEVSDPVSMSRECRISSALSHLSFRRLTVRKFNICGCNDDIFMIKSKVLSLMNGRQNVEPERLAEQPILLSSFLCFSHQSFKICLENFVISLDFVFSIDVKRFCCNDE